MSRDIEQSLKQKLKNISKKENIPVNQLLATLFLERFLVRIEKSKYAEKLILKGGICLIRLFDLGRETRDIDFLLNEVKGSADSIKDMIQEIALIDVNDNFQFTDIELGELSIEHKKYPGYRMSIQGNVGKIKGNVSIDVGIGDVVYPKTIEIELMRSGKPLFEDSIALSAYPPEYIFSEKIEAILHLGESNSRMKDFYDCYRLIKEDVLDQQKARQALIETTENRGTKLELVSENVESFKQRWNSFLKKNHLENLDLSVVVSEINSVLEEIIRN